jgi:hypothetical protein
MAARTGIEPVFFRVFELSSLFSIRCRVSFARCCVREWPGESLNKSSYIFVSGWRALRMKLLSTNELKFYSSHCDQPLKCDPCDAGRQIQCPKGQQS